MKIDFARGMSDAKRWFRHSGLCVRNRMGQNVASSRPASPDRRSPDQLAFRQAVKEAGLAWGALDGKDRQAWDVYARRHAHLLSDQLYKDLSGWEVFLPAFLSRALLGAVPPPRPAVAAPPEAVTTIEELPATEDDTFSFRVTHGVAPEGHVLIVRITPPTATRARRPYARTARMIRAHCPDSVVPLPPSGGVVTFPQARFSIAPGQRFGVTMRIMRLEDGVVSREFFADLLRAEPPTDRTTPSEPPPPQKKGAPAPPNAPASKDADEPYLLHDVHPLYSVHNRPAKAGLEPVVCRRSGTLGSGTTPLAHPDQPSLRRRSVRGTRGQVPQNLESRSEPVRELSPNLIVALRPKGTVFRMPDLFRRSAANRFGSCPSKPPNPF